MKDRIYSIKPGYLVENVAGQYILLAPAVGDIDYTKMMVLSESAALIVNILIARSSTLEEMLQSLLQVYEVDEETARKELLSLLAQLEQLKILL